jgi:hypothetical protein
MRLFRVFIRAQSEFLFRCYSDPIFYKDWGSGQAIVFSHGWPLADPWMVSKRPIPRCPRSSFLVPV